MVNSEVREPRSVADLTTACTVIGYEMRALVDAHGHRDADNAFLESSLLHARNLIEFLIGRSSRRATDMAPEDFSEGWEPRPEPSIRRLREHLDQIDKHLAHLTWARVDWRKDATAEYWNYPELATDVLAVFTEFARFVQSHGAPCSGQLVAEAHVSALRLARQAEGPDS